MKNLEYICMAVVFVLAAFSLAINFRSGFHAWIWQFNLLIWVGTAFLYKRRLDKLNN